MKLAEVVDLEWQLWRDEEAARAGDWEALMARDRALGEEILRELGVDSSEAQARVAADRRFRQQLCVRWRDRVRRIEPDLPGERVEKGYRLVRWLAVLLGLLLGVGAASAALAYDGRQPVNVFGFVAVFFVLQILLLVLLLWFLLRSGRGGHGQLGLVHALLARVIRARFVDRLLGERTGQLTAVLGVLRSRQSLYGQLERWMLLGTTQAFGVAFNLAALGTCLWLIAFTDLAFCWSTTLELEPRTVHGWMTALAFPWAWTGEAVPSLEVVQASQWVRIRQSFAGELSLQQATLLSGQWWSFLVAGLVCWGLLPRVAALALAAWRQRRTLRAAALDHVELQHLYERLLPPQWSGPRPQEVGAEAGGAAAAASGRDGALPRPTLPAAGPCWVVCWGRLAQRAAAVADVVQARFRCAPAGTVAAGGAELAGDRAAREALAAATPPPALVVVALEAGLQPVKEVFTFLAELRAALEPRTHVVVVLVEERADGTLADGDPDELAQWRQRVEGQGDPYLRLEATQR